MSVAAQKPRAHPMRTNLLACSLAVALAACGSQVVPPSDPLPDGAAPPSGPRSACLPFCERGDVRCMTRQDCTALCDGVLRWPGAARCPSEVTALLTCAVRRDAYRCDRAAGTFRVDTTTCAAESEGFQRCANGPRRSEITDGGAGVSRACWAACTLSDRACGTTDTACRLRCAVAESSLSDTCFEAWIEFTTCIDRSGLVCERGRPAPAPPCDRYVERLAPCGIGGSVFSAVDAGSAPDV